MAGLTDKSLKDSYKNIVIVGDTTWDGVTATLAQLKDGAGKSLPLKVASNKLRIDDGVPIELGGENVYIKNDNQRMNLAAQRVYGTAASFGSYKGTTASLASASLTGQIKAATGVFTGKVVVNTLSLTGLNAGTIEVTTISAGTIKGTIQPGTGKDVVLSGGKIVLATNFGVRHDDASVVVQANSKDIAKFRDGGIIPIQAAATIGTNASRFGNLYSASAKFKNLYASYFNIAGGTGTMNVSNVSSKKAAVNTLAVASNLHLKNGASLWLRTDKSQRIEGREGILDIFVGAGGVHVEATGIYPEDKDDTFMGIGSNTWKKGYVDKVIGFAISSASKFRLSAVSIFMQGVPLSGANVAVGQIYCITGTNILKIKRA